MSFIHLKSMRRDKAEEHCAAEERRVINDK